MPVKRKTTSKKKSAVKKTIARKLTTKKKTVSKQSAVGKKMTARKPTKKKSVVKKKVSKKTATKQVVKRKHTTKKKTVIKKMPAKKKKIAKKKTPKTTSTRKRVIAKKTKSTKQSIKKKSAGKKVVQRSAAKKPIKKAVRVLKTKKPAPIPIDKEHINPNIIGPVPSILPYEAKPGEVYMSDKQSQHFVHVLLTWRRDLMEGVDKTVGHLKEDAENYADLSDRATQEEEFNLELRTRDRERKLLKKIEAAIRRINEDNFGYCQFCGVEIGLPRLEARPTATLCIDCKTVEEIREKQTTL